jgi:SnoaL-like polyketide cyclase
MSCNVRHLLERYYMGVWLRGDATALAELLANDYVDHDPMPGFGADKAAAMQSVTAFTTGMRNVSFDALDVIVERERAAAHWTLRWTHAGSLLGSPANSKVLRLRGHDSVRIRDN